MGGACNYINAFMFQLFKDQSGLLADMENTEYCTVQMGIGYECTQGDMEVVMGVVMG